MTFRYEPKTEQLIVTKASRIEYHQLDIWLTRKVHGFRFVPAFKMGIWDGNKSYFDEGKISLGLWKECYNACKEIGVIFNLENKEEFPINREVTLEKVTGFCKEFFKDHKVKNKKTGEWEPFYPYDYQIESAYKALKNRYCLLEIATSGGKSLTLSICIFYILKKINKDAKFLIIVPSINLVSQFYDNILEYNFGEQNLEKLDTKEKNKEMFPNACDLLLEEIMS